MVNIQSVNTVALTVPNADLAQKFYTQALGFQVVGDSTFEADTYSQLASIPPSRTRLVTLQLGDELIELVQYLDIESRPIPEDSQSHDLWFQHLAIVVSDMDKAYGHLKGFDIQPISSGPQTIPADNPLAGGVRAFKFRDSDRQSLELIWFPAGKGKDKWQRNLDQLFLGIDHTAMTVSDADKSLKFYRDTLGMEVSGSNLQTGETQAALDGLPVAEVKITPLEACAKDSLDIELLDYVWPRKGRPIPRNWKISALAHMHVILEVKDIQSSLEKLMQQGAEIVSPNVIDFPKAYRYDQGCLIRDPDGHALLLATLP